MANSIIPKPAGYPKTTATPLTPNKTSIQFALVAPDSATNGTVKKIICLGSSNYDVNIPVSFGVSGAKYITTSDYRDDINNYSSVAIVEWSY